jgi:ATP-binding cassette subfamily B protein
VQAALAGAERVREVLELPVATPPARAATSSRATGLVLRDVSFAYPGGEPVLRGVSVSVAPGERVALVGRTGSGKSTLLALAVGLYEPSAGEVLLLGGSPAHVDESRRRRALGVVPQRVQLFSGSLRDNVTLLDESIDDEAVRRALSLVGLDAVLASLPEGLDTVLVGSGGGEGLALSAGERQLVALARALVVPPAVLVLDEATATGDASSDAAFHNALSGAPWSASCAVLTGALRISPARGADRVVVLDAGRVVEEGTPATLIARAGRFASLVELDEAGWDWSGHASRRNGQ